MKTLDVQARLEFARAGVAVLRMLAMKEQRARYKKFATAIGLIGDDEKWRPWHRQQVADNLQVMAATERTAGKNVTTIPLNFSWIVNEKGEPGSGISKMSKIVRM